MPDRALPNWLLAYRDFAAQSEAPEPYHFWCAMVTLSAAVRRHVWLDWGLVGNVYPNLYVVLVSPPGAARKGGAMSIARRLLSALPDLQLQAEKLTPEAMIHALSGGTIELRAGVAKKPGAAPKAKPGASAATAPAAPLQPEPPVAAPKPTVIIQTESASLIYSPELSVTLGADSAQNGMLAMLTNLFDCPDEWKYRTVKWGEVALQNCFLSLLGATTPEWIGTSIPRDSIGGGFTSRILFVCQTEKRHSIARPVLTLQEVALREKLQFDLKRISALRGEMKLSPDAVAWFDEWYAHQDTKALDERFWGYLERKPFHLLRAGMLISMAESDDLVMTERHLRIGLSQLDNLEVRMPEAFRTLGASGAREIEQITDYLIKANGILMYQEIVSKLRRQVSSRDLNIILQTMKDAGMVEEIVQRGVRMVSLKNVKVAGAAPGAGGAQP